MDDPTGLAGWLYTDLMLGLVVVFLGSAIFFAARAEGSSEPVVPTTTTVPAKTCAALGREAQLIRLSVDSRLPNPQLHAQAQAQVVAGLAAKHLDPGTRFGFALAFGGPDPGTGPQRARTLVQRLIPGLPARLADLQYRSYWAGDINDAWTVRVELFPLVTVPC